MARYRLLPVLAASAAACVFASSVMAQNQAAKETVLVNPNVAPAKKQPEPLRASRAISPEVAAQLQGYAPKYTPPPPKPTPKPEDEEVDAREVDKPRNGIIRLPKYIVQEPKSPVLNERAASTTQ